MVYLFSGQKGTGKTLSLVSLMNKRRKQYKYIFCNKPYKNMKKIDNYNWVFQRFPENSAIIIDEAQLYFNSREFSKLTKNGVGMALLDFLTMCRHYKLDIFFITQSCNRIDLQIRELSDFVYYLKKTFKIPIISRPFLVFGYLFGNIMEFEKFMNPNNFSKEYDCRFYFKIIHSKDLKAYDTHYIDSEYLEKPLIEIVSYDNIILKERKKYFNTFINFLNKLFFRKKLQNKILQNMNDSNYFNE